MAKIIDILGLAFGFASFIIVVQYFYIETNYDNFHEQSKNIVRVTQETYQGGQNRHRAAICHLAGPRFTKVFPEIIDYVKIEHEDGIISFDNKTLTKERVYSCSHSFFKLFTVNIISGDKNTLLTEPNTAIVTESAARKIFGDKNPMGKLFKHRLNKEYRVVGIIKDLPANSNLKFDFLLSKPDEVSDSEMWWWYGFCHTYLLLQKDVDIKQFEVKINNYIKKITEQGEGILDLTFHLQSLNEVHLSTDLDSDYKNTNDLFYLRIFLIIAITLLLFTLLNSFVFKSIERINRSNELGIKKLYGSKLSSNIYQNIFESLIILVIVMTISLFIISVLLSQFKIFNSSITFLELFKSNIFLGSIMALLVLYLIIIGTIPVIVQKITTINSSGTISERNKNIGISTSFIILQSTLSIIIIFFVIVVYKQIHFMKQQGLNCSTENIFIIKGPMKSSKKESIIFKEYLQKHSFISQVISSNCIPGFISGHRQSNVHLSSNHELKTFDIFWIDKKFFNFFGVDVLYGEIPENFNNLNNKTIINKTGCDILGINYEDAISKTLRFHKGDNEIIAVVNDFNQRSLRYDFNPIVFRSSKTAKSFFSLKLNHVLNNDDLNLIRKDWEEIFPESPFNYFYYDSHISSLYEKENVFFKNTIFFSIAILILAIVSIVALTYILGNKLRKNLCLHKIFGATKSNLFIQLSKRYLLIIVISSIGLPLGYYISNTWLINFAFKIDISIIYFILPIVALTVITFLSMIAQTFRTINTNPTNELRKE